MCVLTAKIDNVILSLAQRSLNPHSVEKNRKSTRNQTQRKFDGWDFSFISIQQLRIIKPTMTMNNQQRKNERAAKKAQPCRKCDEENNILTYH